jgi:hypothetical protein
MTKEFNVGSVKIALPDYNSDVGRAIEFLQNQYESGNIRSMLLVYATKDSIGSAIVGDAMTIPFVTMAASTIANEQLSIIEDSLSSHTKKPE